MKENSIEEEIKIALDKFLDNKDKDSAILIVEKFILGNYILIRGGRTNIVKDSLRYILLDYKRVLKENEEYKKAIDVVNKEKADWIKAYQEEKDKQFDLINKISSNDFIQKQKVKDRIEELKNNPLKIKQNDKYYYETDAYNKIVVQVLQELLEESEE